MSLSCVEVDRFAAVTVTQMVRARDNPSGQQLWPEASRNTTQSSMEREYQAELSESDSGTPGAVLFKAA